jgi:hypothetical protein
MACQKKDEEVYAASKNESMSSWDLTSQWLGRTNGFLELELVIRNNGIKRRKSGTHSRE